ncbi:MAG: hypothetical protein ACD_76C00116G0002 [uncultured bacterium]|nr:MAG: hypothetical protein ACD_76C00116G0002 [uncultured bacterium]HBD05527.1 hypothetical protein [Candidatus Uhrbacteria bacterium]
MFTSMSKPSSEDTIIAQGVKVEGDFSGDSNMIIEGEVTGTVVTTANLRVGVNARISADVSAASAVIAGEVKGNISVADKLDLLETSVIHGDIDAHVLSVASGAKINGRVSMNGKKTLISKKTKKDEESELSVSDKK